ncbi:MAG TPA: ABC transporter permease [Armatimonadota bacterium]|nr:ABC transporter permease [Armatimonadota bacterium]
MPLPHSDSALLSRRSDPHEERPEGRLWLWLGSLFFLILALLPLVALVWASVPAQPLQRLREPVVQQALWLSLGTSATSTVLCVLMGLPVAYLLARHRFPGRDLLDTLIDLPMTLPPVVAGLALLLTFGRMGLLGRYLEAGGVRIAFSTAAVVLAQTFMAAPFFIRAARAGFQSVPLDLEHAAMTLGRNRWSVFWSISVPLAAPALLAGTVLAWARALSEFGATLVFAGNFPGMTQTLPLAVMSEFERELESAVAVAVVSLALALGALAGARVVAGRWNA